GIHTASICSHMRMSCHNQLDDHTCSVQLVDAQVSATHRAKLPIGTFRLLPNLIIFDPCAAVQQHQVRRMVHDQARVVGMADDHHFEVGSRWLSITFRLSTEYVCGADGIGQEGVRHVPVLSLAYFDDIEACWEILSTGERTYQCRVTPNLRSLVAWHGLVTQGA